MKIKFLVAALMSTAVAVPAMSAQLVTNGDFEAGFSGWSTLGNGSGQFSCDQDWTYNGTSPCYSINGPIGTGAAYTSFDGNGPKSFRLFQNVTIGAGTVTNASLTWNETFQFGYSQLPRTLTVDIFDVTGMTLITTLFTETFGYYDTSNGNWQSRSANPIAQLAGLGGQTVRLAFSANIPQAFTGPAAFGIDNISFNVDTAVPEPGMIGLLGVGIAGLALRRRRRAA